MTQEEERESMHRMYAAQLEGMGYGPDGMALPKDENPKPAPVSEDDAFLLGALRNGRMKKYVDEKITAFSTPWYEQNVLPHLMTVIGEQESKRKLAELNSRIMRTTTTKTFDHIANDADVQAAKQSLAEEMAQYLLKSGCMHMEASRGRDGWVMITAWLDVIGPVREEMSAYEPGDTKGDHGKV